jgi:hypothetical protein
MKRLLIIFLSVAMLVIHSCSEPQQRIARSVGATSEILVVTQNAEQWNGAEGAAIRAFFEQPQYGLPQDEPLFRLSSLTIDKLSDMFKKHRNILVVETNNKLNEAQVETRSNLWANPQRVIKITAPDSDRWIAAFNENKDGFKLLFDKSERERLMNIFRPTANIKVMDPLMRQFGIKLTIPEGFYVAKQESNFMWIRKETNEFSNALIIYSIPYNDTIDLNPKFLIARRDSVLQRYIPGPTLGSFMTTDKEFIVPQVINTTHFVTPFAVEMRGVWNVVGDFMGGPFLSYTIVDERRGRLLTIEGYVYFPNKPKRDHLRQLEAILYSFEFYEEGTGS